MKLTLPIIATLLFIVGCSEKHPDTKNQVIPETPKALQDGYLKSFSGRGYDYDLVEELYRELVENNTALKKLEAETENVEKFKSETLKNYNKYEAKSTSYYDAASQKINVISDSLLKKRLDTLINISLKNFKSKNADLEELVNTIHKNELSFYDKHTALKIVLTLNIIQQYQNNNKPDKKDFNETLKQQKDLIERVDSLTPAY